MLKKFNILKQTEGCKTSPLFVLSLKDITLSFDNAEPLFETLSLELAFSGIVVLKGRVGSGKTSILKLLAGLIQQGSGSVSLKSQNGSELEPIYIHSNSEFNFVTGYVNDELALSGINDISVIDPMFHNRSIYDLSGGELKRLSIMIAAKDIRHSIVLLDEPLDMLDDDWCVKIASQIIESSTTRGFIIATHDDDFDTAADYIIEIV